MGTDILKLNGQIHCKNGIEKYFPGIGLNEETCYRFVWGENCVGREDHVLNSFCENLSENFCF